MALIKQAAEVKPKLQKKEITIKQATWKEAENYIKYAGLRGSNQEKIEFLVEEALLHVFATDEGYKKYCAKPAAKVVPSAATQKTTTEIAKEVVSNNQKPQQDKKWAK